MYVRLSEVAIIGKCSYRWRFHCNDIRVRVKLGLMRVPINIPSTVTLNSMVWYIALSSYISPLHSCVSNMYGSFSMYAAVVLQGVESLLIPVLLGMNSKLIRQEDQGKVLSIFLRGLFLYFV